MKYVALLLLSWLFFSCNESSNTSLKSKVDPKAVIQQLYETFNAHQWKEMASLYADTAQFKDPSFGPYPITQTHAEIMEKYKGLEEAIPDVKDSVLAMYLSGEHSIIVEFISTGTMNDSSKLYLPICTIFTLNNEGKITHDFTYYDNQ